METGTVPESDAASVLLVSKSCLTCKHCDCTATMEKKCRRVELITATAHPYLPTFLTCRTERSPGGECGEEGKFHEPFVPFYLQPRRRVPIFPLPELPPVSHPYVPLPPVKWSPHRPRLEDRYHEEPPVWDSYSLTSLEVATAAIVVVGFVFLVIWCIMQRTPSY